MMAAGPSRVAGLELAAPGEEGVGGQLDLVRHAVLRLGDEAAEVHARARCT